MKKSFMRMMTACMLCLLITATACMNDVRKSGNELEKYNVSKGNIVYSEKAIPMVNINGTYYVSSKTLLDHLEYDFIYDEQQKNVSFGYSDILYQVFANRSEAIKAEETVRLSTKPIWKDGQVWFPETMMDELLRDEVLYTIKHHHLILHPLRKQPPIVAEGSNRSSQRDAQRRQNDVNDSNESSPPSYGWNTIQNPYVREGQSLSTQPESEREQRPHEHSPNRLNSIDSRINRNDSSVPMDRKPSGFQMQSQSNTSVNASELIQYAKKYLGVEYEFGASPYPKSGTFDCSSYVAHVFGQFGIDLPRSSRSQSKLGQTVSRSQLQPGDLMFFSVPGRFSSDNVVGHVAIYIGDGKMIHSSPAPENGVQITNIDHEHWKNTYLFAKRIQ